jgi:hypothetical protein
MLNEYAQNVRQRAFFFRNMIFLTKMEDYVSLQHPLLKFKDIRDQLKAIDRKVKEDFVIIMLKYLLPSSENLFEALNITLEDIDLTFEQLSNKIFPKYFEKEVW